MCFDVESDWCAVVNESVDGPLKLLTGGVCFECGAKIFAGDACRMIHQQEYDMCQECEDESSSLYRLEFDDNAKELEPTHCRPGEHDYGETFDAILCMGCVKIRDAIRAYEIKEGCPEWSSVPLIGDLRDVFVEHQQKWDYADACVASHPELIEHPLIAGMLAD